MSANVRFSRLAAAVVCVAAVGLSGVSPAAADRDDVKPFTLNVSGTTAAAPDTFAGDAHSTVALTITNLSREQKLGSANITVPSVYSLLSVSAPGDAVAGGPVVELRGLALAPKAAVTVTLVVAVTSCVPASPLPFAVVAKQSNDFSGVGNNFALVAASSHLQVNVVGQCSLSFIGQPTDAKRNTSITTAAFTPAGTPITVEVRDAGNTGRATSLSAVVSLGAANPVVPAPIAVGNSTATAVNGLATFVPGPTLGVSSSGYTFTAASAGLTSSAPSARFAIVDDVAPCLANTVCGNPVTSTLGGHTITAAFGTGGSATNLTVLVGAPDAPAFACTGYLPGPGTVVSEFAFSGDLGGDRVGTFTETIANAVVNKTHPLSSYQVCWASSVDFVAKGGQMASAVLDLGDGAPKPGTTTGQTLKVGLLPSCLIGDGDADDPPPTLPCLDSRSYNSATTTVTITVRTTGNDPWRYA